MPTWKKGDDHGCTGRANAFRFDPDKLILVTDKTDPLYDPRVDLPVNEALVLNIMKRGVIKPLVVVTRKSDKAPIVLDGKQRTKAAREASKRFVEAGEPAITVLCIQRTGNAEELNGVSIAANEFAQVDSPVTRGARALRMLNLGAEVEDIAQDFGVKPSAVKSWLELQECSKVLQRAVDAGDISVSAAIKLGKLPENDQATALESLMEENKAAGRTGKVTTRQAKKATGSGPSRMKISEVRAAPKNKPLQVTVQGRAKGLADKGKSAEAIGWEMYLDGMRAAAGVVEE